MINHDESWQVWIDKNQGCVIIGKKAIIYRLNFHAKNIIKLLKFLRTFLPLIFCFTDFSWFKRGHKWWIRSDQTWKYALTKNLSGTKKYPRVPEVKVMLGFIFNCVIAHQRLGLPRHTKFPFMLSHVLKIERNSFFLPIPWKINQLNFRA